MKLLRTTALASWVCALAISTPAPPAQANVPAEINYQGMVRDQNGQPFASGSYCFRFAIYDGPLTGANQVWQSTDRPNIEVVNGYFNVVLGLTAPFGDVFDSSSRYLGVTVASDCPSLSDEIQPRQQILSAPYAIAAADLRGAVSTDSTDGNGKLIGKDSSNMERFRLELDGATDTARLKLNDSTGATRAELSHDENERGRLVLSGPASDAVVAGARSDGNGFLDLYAGSGNLAATLDSSAGAGRLTVLGPNGFLNAVLGPSSDLNTGLFELNDQNGSRRVYSYIAPSGEGRIFLYGPNGTRTVGLWRPSSSLPNDGWIGVYDPTDTARAGIYASGSSGVVFGTSKSFVVDHPRQPGKKIVYVSLEGPEGAIFFRGRVRLQDGRAKIDVPEHFAALAAWDTATVSLTPHSRESMGVAVGTIAESGIEIGELLDGRGNYEVSYVVQVTRNDMLDHQPVISEETFQATFGGGQADPDAAGSDGSETHSIDDLAQNPNGVTP